MNSVIKFSLSKGERRELFWRVWTVFRKKGGIQVLEITAENLNFITKTLIFF